MKDSKEIKQLVLWAMKIAVGSCLSIYIADAMHLESHIAAGSVTLLTLVTTKWETVKLSLYRLITFVITVAFCWLFFLNTNSVWLAYGCFTFMMVIICGWMEWKATISVNALIAMHFLTQKDFSMEFILNEFMLVLIGITMAVILNLFNNNLDSKEEIISGMRHVEQRLQMILGEMAAYLSNKEMQRNVWDDIIALERDLEKYIGSAYDYQNNTFQSHPQYYIEYYEMRSKQTNILHNLHYKMKKMRHMPKQAAVVADYILYMMDYVVEINVPAEQMERLSELFGNLEKEELPVTREEFESRAILYHILTELEEFLVVKRRFVDGMSDFQWKEYWKREKEEK